VNGKQAKVISHPPIIASAPPILNLMERWQGLAIFEFFHASMSALKNRR
jgi:hypothetical protein